EAQALYYSEYHEGRDKKPTYHTRRINLKLPVSVFGLVGSCNGLICLSSLTNYSGISIGLYQKRFHPEEPSYICNPITREIVNLPSICINKKESDMGVEIIFGFGYHPLTKEYKIVRISYIGLANGLPPSRGMVEVYTLGGNGWRNTGETTFFLKSNYSAATSVCVNGSLHWVQEESREIVAFDLADEKFHLVPSPSFPGETFNEISRSLCVRRSCLCLITLRGGEYNFSGCHDLWLLNEKKEDESIISYRTVDQPYKSQSWSKEWSMICTLKGRSTVHGLFALTKGSEFLLHIGNESIRYNSDTKTGTTIWVSEDGNWNRGVPISHINSFVSLRAQGERNVETFIGSSNDTELDLHEDHA
ncbi:hypothetical protein MKX03_014628, partial [Papaver bracteatum]